MAIDTLWFIIGLLLGAGGLVFWLRSIITERLDRVTDQLDKRLRENVHATNESKFFLADRVSMTERTVREVSTSLGKLEHATAALQRTNQEIASFQQMLRHPKIRGSFGEVLLLNLLGTVLPAEHYRAQYTLPGNGTTCDAIIRLQDGYLVAIDAKFPLANYELFVHAIGEPEKKQAYAAFLRDVKKHISDIAQKYISPSDKTLDYAFMYIPSEGIYYETIVRDSAQSNLWEFCLNQRVIPVSPNSFLAYLQTIVVGLRGFKIQQQALDIVRSLSQIRQEFNQFGKEFAMVGTHLNNAKNRFDDSARRLDRFGNRLEGIESGLPDPQKTVVNTAAKLPGQSLE